MAHPASSRTSYPRLLVALGLDKPGLGVGLAGALGLLLLWGQGQPPLL